MDGKRIREIRERCGRATPGPWYPNAEGGVFSEHGSVLWGNEYGLHLEDNDEKFIGHSREDVSFLLSELRRLQGERQCIIDARNSAIESNIKMIAEIVRAANAYAGMTMLLRDRGYCKCDYCKTGISSCVTDCRPCMFEWNERTSPESAKKGCDSLNV